MVISPWYHRLFGVFTQNFSSTNVLFFPGNPVIARVFSKIYKIYFPGKIVKNQ